jgi:hypothetical protein
VGDAEAVAAEERPTGSSATAAPQDQEGGPSRREAPPSQPWTDQEQARPGRRVAVEDWQDWGPVEARAVGSGWAADDEDYFPSSSNGGWAGGGGGGGDRRAQNSSAAGAAGTAAAGGGPPGAEFAAWAAEEEARQGGGREGEGGVVQPDIDLLSTREVDRVLPVTPFGAQASFFGGGVTETVQQWGLSLAMTVVFSKVWGVCMGWGLRGVYSMLQAFWLLAWRLADLPPSPQPDLQLFISLPALPSTCKPARTPSPQAPCTPPPPPPPA